MNFTFINITEQDERHLSRALMAGLKPDTATSEEIEIALENMRQSRGTHTAESFNANEQWDVEDRRWRWEYNSKAKEGGVKFDSSHMVMVPSAMLSFDNGQKKEVVENFKMPVTHEFTIGGRKYVSDGHNAVCVEKAFETHNKIYAEVKKELEELFEVKKHEETRSTEPTGL